MRAGSGKTNNFRIKRDTPGRLTGPPSLNKKTTGKKTTDPGISSLQDKLFGSGGLFSDTGDTKLFD